MESRIMVLEDEFKDLLSPQKMALLRRFGRGAVMNTIEMIHVKQDLRKTKLAEAVVYAHREARNRQI